VNVKRTATILAVAAIAGWMTGCEKQPVGEVVAETLRTPTPTPLSQYWQVPEFSLTERSGATVSPAELKGKIWVVDFFYTTCPGPCPTMTGRLTTVHAETRGMDDVRLVSITLDPAKDSVEMLRTYAEGHGADDRWLFCRGDKEAIYKLANEGFKVSAVENPGAEEPITHSTKFILVDGEGWVRGFYEGTTEEGSKQLVGDIRRLCGGKP
jgi:protein SCO1/2